MPAEWIMRKIDAPDRPVLKAGDVASLFGYDSEDSVMAMVRAGQLPEPLKRGGSNVWEWEDVVLCRLLISRQARMRPLEAGDEPRKSPKDAEGGRKPPKIAESSGSG